MVSELRADLLEKLDRDIRYLDRPSVLLGKDARDVSQHDVHMMAAMKQEHNRRLANAFGIRENEFVEGAAFDQDLQEQKKLDKIRERERILEEREKHPEKTLAELYDPDKMPAGLREAHRLNDEAVERCYRSTPFTGDEERLEYLFKLYEKMIAEEQQKGTLFETQKKTRKKKTKKKKTQASEEEEDEGEEWDE